MTRVHHLGQEAYDRSPRPVVAAPEVCLAVRPAAAAQPGSLLPRPDRRPPRPPDRLELQTACRAPGAAAAPAYEPAVRPERLDRAERSARLHHLVRLAPAASLKPEPAVQAEQPGFPQFARPSFQVPDARRVIPWVLEAEAGPIRVRRQGPAVHSGCPASAEMEYEAALEWTGPQLGRRPGVAVVVEPSAAIPASVARAAQAPASVGSAAPVGVAGSAERSVNRSNAAPCSGRLGSRAPGPGPWRQQRCWQGLLASASGGSGGRCSRTDPADRETPGSADAAYRGSRVHPDALPRSRRRGQVSSDLLEPGRWAVPRCLYSLSSSWTPAS